MRRIYFNIRPTALAVVICTAMMAFLSTCDQLDPDEADEEDYIPNSGTVFSSGQIAYQYQEEVTDPDGYSWFYCTYKAPINLCVNYDLYYTVKKNPEKFSSGTASLGTYASILQGMGMGDIANELLQSFGGIGNELNAVYQGLPIATGGNYPIITNPESGERELDYDNNLPTEIGNSFYVVGLHGGARGNGFVSGVYTDTKVQILMKPDGNGFKYQLQIKTADLAVQNGQTVNKLVVEEWVHGIAWNEYEVYAFSSPGATAGSGSSDLGIDINRIESMELEEIMDGASIDIPAEDLERFLAHPDTARLTIPLDVSHTISSGATKAVITRTGWSGHNASLPGVDCQVTTTEEYEKWIPEGGENENEIGNTLHIKVHLHEKGKPAQLPVQRCKFEIYLRDTSKETGVCNNFPVSNAKNTYDLKIIPNEKVRINDEDAQAATSIDNLQEVEFDISSHDFGAFGALEVIAVLDDGQRIIAYINADVNDHFLEIPKDDNINFIADAWEEGKGYGNDPFWDGDAMPTEQRNNGDGYTLYEEYRGFKVINGDNKHHIRTNPMEKDLFIYDRNGLAQKYFGSDEATNNPAELKLHYINETHIPYVEGSTAAKARCTNFNSASFHDADQYAVVVVEKAYHPTSRSICGMADNFDNPETALRDVFVCEIYTSAIRSILSSSDPDGKWYFELSGANLDLFYEDWVKQTVIHEIGHALGIEHHGGGSGYKEEPKEKWQVPYDSGLMWLFGVEDCAMRYTRQIEHSRLTYPFTRHHYCTKNESWSVTVDGQPHTFAAHNCWKQINVKMK